MDAPAVRADGLTKRYGRTVALDHLDLEVPAGQILGYLGPNGAGKTTTLRLLLGLIRPTSGRAEIFGVDAWRDPVRAHAHVAYVTSDVDVWPTLTGGEVLDLLGHAHGSVDVALRDELITSFDLDPTRRVRAYSTGNRQKVLLIAALMTRADLLVLDEPTRGLDPLVDQVFRTYIRQARDRGQTVVLSSHELSEVEALCDQVAIVRAGRLVEQRTLAELRQLSALAIEATFPGPPPDLSAVPGVHALEVEGSVLRCQVDGSIEPLLRALAEAGVTRMTSREPSLEELFLAHYDRADVPSP